MAEPLASLDPGGRAVVISYNVPEPTSYSGRNFIELSGIPREAFKSPAQPLASGDVSQPVVSRLSDEATRGATAVTGRMISPVDVAVVPGAGEECPVGWSPIPLSERVAALTNAEVSRINASGSHVALFRNIAGQLDMQVARAGGANLDDDDGGDGPEDPSIPLVWVTIRTPSNGSNLQGTDAGLVVILTGSYSAENLSTGPTLSLALDDGAFSPVTVNPTNGTWGAQVTITSAGTHTLHARIVGAGYNSQRHSTSRVMDNAQVVVTAALSGNGNASALPSLTISSPSAESTFSLTDSVVRIPVQGTALADQSRKITAVSITDSTDGTTVQAGNTGTDFSTWAVELPFSSLGQHKLTARAVDDLGHVSPEQSIVVKVTSQPSMLRLKNRLLIVETLNLSSYLGAFGAGGVIKTFTLLPGEKTTISVKSWTKSAQSKKAGSSIVDSEASEAASDFEDTLSNEQSTNRAAGETSGYKVGAQASGSWGMGSASINAEVSGSANASRQEAVKNIANATRKHSMKASANRSVDINTEYTSSLESGVEESTTREISNINVSRVLNFVFRLMNQQHITLIHLTNVRVASYSEDLMLDATGHPAYRDAPGGGKELDIRRTYVELPLPDLQRLLANTIVDEWQPKVRDAIVNALSGIPDYQDEMRSVIEYVTPTKDGQPVAGAEYMRFPRNLATDFVDPESGIELKIPGIVLGYDHIVMKTEGVMVDAVLGQGDALDSYSSGLQEMTLAEREMALAERQSELDGAKLVRDIITSGNVEQADLYRKLHAPDPAPAPWIKVEGVGTSA